MKGFFGGEVHLLALARGMLRRGHEVQCVVRPGSDLENRLRAEGVAVRPLPLTHWFDVAQVRRLTSLLRDRGPGILHSHLPRDYYTAATASLGCPVVNVGTRHQLHPIRVPWLKHPFLSRFHTMIAVSGAVRQGVLAGGFMPDQKVRTIPNGTPLPEGRLLGRPVRRGPLRQACGAGPEDPLVGFVGRITPDKGLATAIRAVAQLADRHAGLRLCVVGQESGRKGHAAALQGLAADLGMADRVHFLGYRTDADRAGRELDVQVVPSQAEPFGLVTIEAMAWGCPVVATRAGGSTEIVRDGVEGFLVEPGDWRRLAGRLDVLLDSPGLAAEMGRRGRRRVVRHYSLEGMLDRTELVYRQALASLPAQVLREDEASA